MDFDAKREELYIDLPEPARSAPGVSAAVRSGKKLYVGGMLPFAEGRLISKGRVGVEVQLDSARLAARAATIQSLAVVASESGGTLNRVKRIVTMDCAIACSPEFRDHQKVADGGSELLHSIFGPVGQHARSIIGVASLPLGASVAISLLVEIK